MSDSILKETTKDFAKKMINLCRELKLNSVEGILINQLLRCGTSIGANVSEAQYAQGKKDMISKFEIALKECNESEYWLELLCDTGCISCDTFSAFKNDCVNIRRMLVASVKKLKG